MSFARDNATSCVRIWPGLHEQECFQYLGYKPGDFPETERAARESLALPIYPEIQPEAQRFVVNAIVEFFK